MLIAVEWSLCEVADVSEDNRGSVEDVEGEEGDHGGHRHAHLGVFVRHFGAVQTEHWSN